MFTFRSPSSPTDGRGNRDVRDDRRAGPATSQRVLIVLANPSTDGGAVRGDSWSDFIVASRFKPHAVRDGPLVTGQQRYSGSAAGRSTASTDVAPSCLKAD